METKKNQFNSMFCLRMFIRQGSAWQVRLLFHSFISIWLSYSLLNLSLFINSLVDNHTSSHSSRQSFTSHVVFISFLLIQVPMKVILAYITTNTVSQRTCCVWSTTAQIRVTLRKKTSCKLNTLTGEETITQLQV